MLKHINRWVQILDTTPPTATAVDKQIYTYESLEPEAFVTDIKDISDVTVAFSKEPSFGTVGKHTVMLVLTDGSGNVSRIYAELNIIKDTVAPVFSEMEDLVVQIGEAISYRKGVTATDNRDETVNITVDSSLVETD